MEAIKHTIILCPLFHDEDCFRVFAKEVESVTSKIEGHKFSLLVVNDGSGLLQLSSTLPLTIINLHRNTGHQKAIAIGMAYCSKQMEFDNIIIMDCDGEDRPEDIPLLIQGLNSNLVVVAKRMKRKERTSFKWFYFIYKFLFRILTGRKISFGNYMALTSGTVHTIVHHSEIWNHLAGALVKSNFPLHQIAIERGKRYSGESKMNFSSLLLHGLGAIGVFIEVIAIRLLVFSVVMIILSILAILVIISIKLFTENAIPGWATNAVSSMLIVLLQSFLLSLFTIFLYLSSQSQKKFIPALHYNEYVQSVENHI